MRNTARCGTGHDRPESAVTIAGIRNSPHVVGKTTNLIAHLMRMVVYLVRNEEPPNAKAT
jgi:hypothetical protein